MTAMWTEIYQDHFQAAFAKPFDIQIFHGPEGFSLKLATHDWAMRGFAVYASMGLADTLLRNEEEDFGEVILFSDVRDKVVPQLFVEALFFILRNAIPLGSRFSIGFGQRQTAFAERFGKTALYFTRPALPDAKETFDKVRRGENFGRVYQAFFITAEEDEFLDKQGADAFEQEFRKQFEVTEVTKPEEPADTNAQVDAVKFKEYTAQLKAYESRLWQHFSQAASVRRPSCV